MIQQQPHPLSVIAIVLALSATFVMWTGSGQSLNAGVDAIVGPNQVGTVFIQGEGDIIVECNPTDHLLYVYQRTADNKVFFTGVRDYTYDLMLNALPSQKDLSSKKPSDIRNFLLHRQYAKNDEWTKHVKDNKIRKKSELSKAFREWIRSRCKDGSGATRLITLSKETQSTTNLLCVWDEANMSCLIYEFRNNSLNLVGARNTEYDLGLGTVVKDIEHYFPSYVTVEQVRQQHEKFKKMREEEESASK